MFGREEIFTDVPEITQQNIAEIMRKSVAIHDKNVFAIEFLLNYEAGLQPIGRIKKYRSDIDCKCIDNVANEITDFKLSYNWGNQITLVMREKIDSNSEELSEAVAMLNKFYDSENYKSKQQQLARFIEICGVGYTFVDVNTEYEDGESPFTVNVLNPKCTFLVRSNYYLDNRPIMAVTYYCDSHGDKFYTCFTKDARYELDSRFEHLPRSGELNPLGIIPIVEWIRAYDRMGCFERQISEMDNLNLLISDFTNDVEQNTQAIWHGNDVDLPTHIVKNEDGTETEEIIKPKGNDWMFTYTSQEGKTPTVKPLAIDYDYSGMLQNITTRRALILQKCNVPSRNDNSGGSTGIAMSDATGWTQAEIEASRQDQIKDGCKIAEVKIALKALAKCSGFPINSPVRKLKHSDLRSSIKRQKTYEMTTKINAYATGISHGINYKDMLNAINLFDDPQQVAENSKETTLSYLDSVFKSRENESVGGMDEKAPNSGRLDQDNSDQISNSPNIDGITTKNG